MLEIRRGTKEDIVQVAAIYDHILTEEEEGKIGRASCRERV